MNQNLNKVNYSKKLQPLATVNQMRSNQQKGPGLVHMQQQQFIGNTPISNATQSLANQAKKGISKKNKDQYPKDEDEGVSVQQLLQMAPQYASKGPTSQMETQKKKKDKEENKFSRQPAFIGQTGVNEHKTSSQIYGAGNLNVFADKCNTSQLNAQFQANQYQGANNKQCRDVLTGGLMNGTSDQMFFTQNTVGKVTIKDNPTAAGEQLMTNVNKLQKKSAQQFNNNNFDTFIEKNPFSNSASVPFVNEQAQTQNKQFMFDQQLSQEQQTSERINPFEGMFQTMMQPLISPGPEMKSQDILYQEKSNKFLNQFQNDTSYFQGVDLFAKKNNQDNIKEQIKFSEKIKPGHKKGDIIDIQNTGLEGLSMEATQRGLIDILEQNKERVNVQNPSKNYLELSQLDQSSVEYKHEMSLQDKSVTLQQLQRQLDQHKKNISSGNGILQNGLKKDIISQSQKKVKKRKTPLEASLFQQEATERNITQLSYTSVSTLYYQLQNDPNLLGQLVDQRDSTLILSSISNGQINMTYDRCDKQIQKGILDSQQNAKTQQELINCSAQYQSYYLAPASMQTQVVTDQVFQGQINNANQDLLQFSSFHDLGNDIIQNPQLNIQQQPYFTNNSHKQQNVDDYMKFAQNNFQNNNQTMNTNFKVTNNPWEQNFLLTENQYEQQQHIKQVMQNYIDPETFEEIKDDRPFLQKDGRGEVYNPYPPSNIPVTETYTVDTQIKQKDKEDQIMVDITDQKKKTKIDDKIKEIDIPLKDIQLVPLGLGVLNSGDQFIDYAIQLQKTANGSFIQQIHLYTMILELQREDLVKFSDVDAAIEKIFVNISLCTQKLLASTTFTEQYEQLFKNLSEQMMQSTQNFIQLMGEPNGIIAIMQAQNERTLFDFVNYMKSKMKNFNEQIQYNISDLYYSYLSTLLPKNRQQRILDILLYFLGMYNEFSELMSETNTNNISFNQKQKIDDCILQSETQQNCLQLVLAFMIQLYNNLNKKTELKFEEILYLMQDQLYAQTLRQIMLNSDGTFISSLFLKNDGDWNDDENETMEQVQRIGNYQSLCKLLALRAQQNIGLDGDTEYQKQVMAII